MQTFVGPGYYVIESGGLIKFTPKLLNAGCKLKGNRHFIFGTSLEDLHIEISKRGLALPKAHWRELITLEWDKASEGIRNDPKLQAVAVAITAVDDVDVIKSLIEIADFAVNSEESHQLASKLLQILQN